MFLKITAKVANIGWMLSLALLLGAAAPSAKANTYLYTFSFTTGQVLSSLHSLYGPNEQNFGIFAVFVQPTNISSPYTYSALVSPKPGTSATDAWTTGIISSVNLGTGQWMQFSKFQTQSNVTLLNDGSPNLYLGQTYKDDGIVYPFDFGCADPGPCSASNPSLIDALLLPSSKFIFTITTTQLIDHVDLQGKAWGIIPSNPGVFDPDSDKVAGPIPFSVVGTPEPGSIFLVALGVAGLFWFKRQHRAKLSN